MGFEYMHLPCLPLGSKGGISLSFSFCAPVYAKLFKAYHQNDLETARKLQLVVWDSMALHVCVCVCVRARARVRACA
jgi:dihydrodipicolinate synthase/N-acetylneuraminate lyase